MTHPRVAPTTGCCALLLLAACADGDSSSRDGRTRPDSALATDSGPKVVSCSAEVRPGIAVTATDARSGAALGDFTVVIEPGRPDAGGARDSSSAATTWYGAPEQVGRFTLRVTKPGYRSWDTTGVIVTRDACHVRTVSLAVPLAPQ